MGSSREDGGNGEDGVGESGGVEIGGDYVRVPWPWGDGARLPYMWALLGAEVALDHAYKLCTTRLIGETSALAVTLLTTAQRMISLAISAAVLSPTPPPHTLWLGMLFLAVGSVGYALSGAKGAGGKSPRPRSASLARARGGGSARGKGARASPARPAWPVDGSSMAR